MEIISHACTNNILKPQRYSLLATINGSTCLIGDLHGLPCNIMYEIAINGYGNLAKKEIELFSIEIALAHLASKCIRV